MAEGRRVINLSSKYFPILPVVSLFHMKYCLIEENSWHAYMNSICETVESLSFKSIYFTSVIQGVIKKLVNIPGCMEIKRPFSYLKLLMIFGME